MASEAETEPVELRVYTNARRYPMVLGHLGDFRLMSPKTPAQIAAFLGVAWALLQTRGLWAHFGLIGNLVVLAGLPWAAQWALRRVRVQGRPPLRAGLAMGRWARSAVLAPAGERHGRPVRPERPRSARTAVFVVERPMSERG